LCKRGKTKKRSFVFFIKKTKKNEYYRSSTIEDLPLLHLISFYIYFLDFDSNTIVFIDEGEILLIWVELEQRGKRKKIGVS
jgi:exonuclease VII small subunit